MSWDISQFLKGLAEADEAIKKSCKQSVAQYAEHIYSKAARLAPIDTGWLKNSGIIEDAKTEGHHITCELGFNASYAAAVHERLDQYHKQGQAKYLETAMRTEAKKLVPFIKKNLP